MARKVARPRPVPFGTPAVLVNPGQWQWVCKGRAWRWREGPGPNLAVRANSQWRVLPLHMDSLEQAGWFAAGCAFGLKLSGDLNEMDQETHTNEAPDKETS